LVDTGLNWGTLEGWKAGGVCQGVFGVCGVGNPREDGVIAMNEVCVDRGVAGVRVMAVACAAMMALAGTAGAATVTLGAGRTNTLYQDSTGQWANGAGQSLFVGTTATGEVRRGLIFFDTSGIPAGSVVTGVSLSLNMSRTIAATQPVSVHRALMAWGSGASNATGQEGTGAQAQAGDATWLHTFYDDQFWDTPGGDFKSDASGTALVTGSGRYTWSGAGMISDVQGSIDAPGDNLGWFLIGQEDAPTTAKRFDTHLHQTASRWPSLEITYVVPSPGAAMVGVFGLAVWSRRRRGG
jgi:hypothetical protein